MCYGNSEEKIKFIRGVPGHGKDIANLLESIGANKLDPIGYDLIWNPKELFYVGEDKEICHSYEKSTLGKLLLEHGEEIFLEPEFKFNVGDFVAFKKHCRNPCRIIKRYNDKGKPAYIVRDFIAQITTRELEHVLMPFNDIPVENIYHNLTPMKDSADDEWVNDFVECFYDDDEYCCVSIVKYDKALLIRQRENQSLKEYIADFKKLQNELKKFISFLKKNRKQLI